ERITRIEMQHEQSVRCGEESFARSVVEDLHELESSRHLWKDCRLPDSRFDNARIVTVLLLFERLFSNCRCPEHRRDARETRRDRAILAPTDPFREAGTPPFAMVGLFKCHLL